MKQLCVLIFSFILVCCSDKKIQKNDNFKNDSFSVNENIEIFISNLNKYKVKPTFTSSLDSLPHFDKNMKILIFDRNNDFRISINGEKIEVKKLETQNDVWNGKDSLIYTNQVSQIKYYKNLNKILLLLDFDMCTGLGCSVNYQIIYDLKTKNIQPFGRFRTGDDMNIYKIDNENFYLSKTFHGRNAELKDTIYYELFKIDNVKQILNGKKIAEFTFQNEDYENTKTFKSYNLK
mgnify:CR=1 FL=1|jgi:hypothetical protein